MKPRMSFFYQLIVFVSVLAVLLATGCVAQKEGDLGGEAMKPTTPAANAYRQQSGGEGFRSLADLTDTFCTDLLADIGNKRIYLDRDNIKDNSTGDAANFSGYLEQEIDSSCSNKGFAMVYAADEADFLVGVLYRRYGDELRVFFKYHTQDMASQKSIDYQISKNALPPDSFSNSMKYKAKKLARDIARGQEGKKIYVKPVVEGNQLAVTDFSKAFTARVQAEIVREYKDVEVISWSKTRSIKKVEKAANLPQSDIEATGADSALSGEYFIEGDIVAVHLTLKSQKDGRILNASDIDIAKEDISSNLEDKEAETLAIVADVKEEVAQEMVKFSTTRGSEYPMYADKEKIVFTLQVREPLYVYLYNFNSAGELSLLFPFEEKADAARLSPGRLYRIPSPEDAYELIVEPPFGREMLKLFACRRPIPFPEITLLEKGGKSRSIGVKRKQEQAKIASSGRVVHPNDLVDYYRGKGHQLGVELYEDGFVLETHR